MRSVRLSILPFVLGAIFSVAGLAHADTTYNFSYSGSGSDGTVTASGSLLINGTDTIVGITGTRNGSAITSLLPFHDHADQLFNPGGPYLDLNGVSFQVADGTNINVFFLDGVYFDEVFTSDPLLGDDGIGDIPVTFNASPATSPVPEPSGLFLVLTGVLGAAETVRRRLVRS